MEFYLRECKENLLTAGRERERNILVVLGNEACDLDSAVSSLVYAFFLKQTEFAEIVVPVLNVKRSDLRLHTEVAFFLEETSINLDDLICKNEINIKQFANEQRLKVALVDHNVLSDEDSYLQPYVVHIVDHHTVEQPERLLNCLSITIEKVGSCCTLVAKKVLTSEPSIMDPQIAMLLYGTILLDTVCLEESAKRVTHEDRNIISKLEALLEGISREEVFQMLQKAKFDVSGFTPVQLLQKDLKVVSANSLAIAISSVPILLEDLTNDSSLETILLQFCSDNHYNSLIVLGSHISKDGKSVRRQIAVFSKDNSTLEKLSSFLKSLENPSLNMEPLASSMKLVLFFEQKNISLTRKFVLPAVRNFLNQGCINQNGCSTDKNCDAPGPLDGILDPLSVHDILVDGYQVETLDVPDSPKHCALFDATLGMKDISLDGTLNSAVPNLLHAETSSAEGVLNADPLSSMRKVISVHPSELCYDSTNEDQKSLSSLSNKSDVDVFSPTEDIVLPEEDDVDTPEELENSDVFGLESNWSEPIPEMSAAEEYEEERSWKMCVVSGEQRRIDMKVIEPYKKVLSHGGYHGETRNAIIIFSACYLPDRSRKDYDYVMDNLFLYVLSTLDQLVAEDYILVYLHGATERSNMPSFGWLKRCYQMIDRRLRKNLKGLYLVHPTFWLKTIVIMTKPFISSKFSRKLRFVHNLDELSSLIPMDHVCIPDKVKMLEFERVIKEKKREMKKRKSINKNHGPTYSLPLKDRY